MARDSNDKGRAPRRVGVYDRSTKSSTPLIIGIIAAIIIVALVLLYVF